MNCKKCGEWIVDGSELCQKCVQEGDNLQGRIESEILSAPSQSDIPVPTAPGPVSVKYAGFWVRWAALVIDGLVIFIPSMILGAIPIIGWILATVLGYAYFSYMVNRYQDTLGKRALGLMVLSENLEKLTLEKVLMREVVGRLASGLTLNIGYLMAAFTEKKKGLHDYIAGSVVIYRDPNKENKTWLIVLLALVVPLIIIAVIGILSSVVLVSLGSARGKASDASIKSSLLSEVPSAVIYADEEGSYKGYVAKSVLPQNCPGKVITNISTDGKNIAFFAKLCSSGDKYFCADPDSSKLVSQSYALSGKSSCE